MKPWLLASAITLPFLAMAAPSFADPTVVDPNLAVRMVVGRLDGTQRRAS